MTPHPGPEFDWALLRLDGGELMLNTMYERNERPAAPEPSRVATHGDTSLYFGWRDLDAACARFRAMGLAVDDPVVRHDGMRQLSHRPRRLPGLPAASGRVTETAKARRPGAGAPRQGVTL